MSYSSRQPCYFIQNRSQTEARLARRLKNEEGREGCIIWLSESHFDDDQVKEIREHLTQGGYGDCFIDKEQRHFLVPFQETNPARGMAEKLVRPGETIILLREGPPCLSRQAQVPGPAAPVALPPKVEHIAHVGFSSSFRAPSPRAEAIFGRSWERVAFVGQCRRADAPKDPGSSHRVTMWKNSRAYLWLNLPAGKDFRGFAEEVCALLNCKRIKGLSVSRLLAVHVPPAWDAFQFTSAAMSLVVDQGELRPRAAAAVSEEPWAVLHMAVDRLCEPFGRVPFVFHRDQLYDPNLGEYVAAPEAKWNAFLPEAYRQIRVPEAWEAMRAEEWDNLRKKVKVGVIDCAVWDEHRDLRASQIEALDFCRDASWNMPLSEHARRNMHGTVCAGLIGALPPKEGQMGFRGVAPGVKLFAARAFGASRRTERADGERPPGYWLLYSSEAGRTDPRHDDLRESTATPGAIAEAVYRVAFDHECDVISMSFEAREAVPDEAADFKHDQPPAAGDAKWGENGMLAAVLAAAAEHGGGKRADGTRRGCVLVAAAGNVRPTPPRTEMCLPAVHPAVIRVGATSSAGILATGFVADPAAGAGGLREVALPFRSKFLDHNLELALDIAAPGLRLISTSHPYLLPDGSNEARQQFYICALATSDAAPLVAGAAALLIAINPDLSACDVRRVLRHTALASAPVRILRPGPPLVVAAGFGPFGELDVAAACEAVRRRDP